MTSSSIDGFVDRLAAVETGPACNNFFDHAVPGNSQRRRNLEIYLQEMLDRRPKVLLLGRSAGLPRHADHRRSLHQPDHPRGPAQRAWAVRARKGLRAAGGSRGRCGGADGDCDVGGAGRAGIPSPALECLPLAYPRPRAAAVQPHPNGSEATLGTPFWQDLRELFHIETVVAVGNVAHRSLQRNGMDVPKIRHPAHGGRAGFKRGLEELLAAGMEQ